MVLLLAAVTVAADFEAGRIGKVEAVSPTHLRLHLAGETDQDGRNRQANWYYFRVDGAKGRELTLDLTSLPGEYNYKPNRGAVTKDTVPFYSEDNESWRPIERTEYDAAEPRLRLHLQPRTERVWVAHVPPYTNGHLRRLLDEFHGNRWLTQLVIGKSVDGRDLHLLTITDPDVQAASKRVVWLMFRQHSWETGSSWAGEGAVRFLLSNDPEAQQIRRGAIFHVFPLCDPDGVARGGVRFNKHGFDLNRNWDVDDAVKMPEIAAQKKAVVGWVDSGKRLDLFLSVHNTETSEYLEGPPGGDPAHAALGARFFELLREHSTFAPTRPFFRAEATTTAGKLGRMTVSQGLYHARRLPAFLMEQMIARNPRLGRLPTPEDRMRFGAGLAKAAWLAVR